jgi:hypothetical protein
MKKDPQAILQALGREAVLLPIREGSKATMVKGWPEKTFEDTQTSSYQNLLEGASAIAVSLGAPSGGLCSIDFDCEEAMRVFLRVNPFLKETLRTKGRRGANLWVTIYDEKIPPMTHLKDASGEPVGEWRSDRSYTIIAGKHPDGQDYKTIVDAAPKETFFDDILWPAEWFGTPNRPRGKAKEGKNRINIQRKSFSAAQGDFAHLKELYRIDDAWEELGLKGEPSASCCSPLRDDLNPSFSVFDAGRRWKDHGTGSYGDVIDFVSQCQDVTLGDALRWIEDSLNQRINPFSQEEGDE